MPPIQKVYYESVYAPAIGKTAGRQSWNVYIDTKDPDTLGNYYKWNWAHYEFTEVCQKTYVARTNTYTGISCCSPCWDVTRCYTCVNINSDLNINGQAISRQFISEVPFTSLSGYYIEVEQQALSRGAYQFWKSVRQLTSNYGWSVRRGSLNRAGELTVYTSPDESVYGYFGAVGVSATICW